MEDGVVTISRVQASLSFPARLILITAQNPCPCGFLGDKVHSCTCRPHEIERYRRKISGPLLDRIDIQVTVPRLEYDDLKTNRRRSSAVIRSRVVKARGVQRKRFEGSGVHCNAQMNKKQLINTANWSRRPKQCLANTLPRLGSAPVRMTALLKWRVPLQTLKQRSYKSGAHCRSHTTAHECTKIINIFGKLNTYHSFMVKYNIFIILRPLKRRNKNAHSCNNCR